MALVPKDPLLSAGRFLALIAQYLMAFAAILIAITLPVILIFHADIAEELQSEFGDPTYTFPLWETIAVMLLALMTLICLFLFFKKLVQIIGTVGDGDPFVPANASRLEQMGWLMLATQLLSIPMLWIGYRVNDAFEDAERTTSHLDVDGSGLLLVIILFILARVFRRGADMRDDLEGTV